MLLIYFLDNNTVCWTHMKLICDENYNWRLTYFVITSLTAVDFNDESSLLSTSSSLTWKSENWDVRMYNKNTTSDIYVPQVWVQYFTF